MGGGEEPTRPRVFVSLTTIPSRLAQASALLSVLESIHTQVPCSATLLYALLAACHLIALSLRQEAARCARGLVGCILIPGGDFA